MRWWWWRRCVLNQPSWDRFPAAAEDHQMRQLFSGLTGTICITGFISQLCCEMRKSGHVTVPLRLDSVTTVRHWLITVSCLLGLAGSLYNFLHFFTGILLFTETSLEYYQYIYVCTLAKLWKWLLSIHRTCSYCLYRGHVQSLASKHFYMQLLTGAIFCRTTWSCTQCFLSVISQQCCRIFVCNHINAHVTVLLSWSLYSGVFAVFLHFYGSFLADILTYFLVFLWFKFFIVCSRALHFYAVFLSYVVCLWLMLLPVSLRTLLQRDF